MLLTEGGRFGGYGFYLLKGKSIPFHSSSNGMRPSTSVPTLAHLSTTGITKCLSASRESSTS
jgi:hypothetical protein